MNHLLTKYQWNDFFNEVSKFGLSFVDNDRCIKSSKLRGDTHTIIHRLIKDEIPQWIRNSIPEEIIVLQIFAIEPNTVGLIHKDGVDRLCAFNVPVLNCDDGTMDWFDDKEYSIYSIENSYTTIRVSDEQKKEGKKYETIPLYSTLIDTPALVNTNVWHRVDNRGHNNFRWMLSLRFKNNPLYEQVRTAFDYAK